MPYTYTPNYNLAKPSAFTLDWDDEVNTNFDIIDEILKDLENDLRSHATNTNNPHNTVYYQVGAAPAIHTHSGSDITSPVTSAINSDATDNIHFRVQEGLLQFSQNGTNFTTTGDMRKSVYDTDNDGIVDNAHATDNIHFRVQGGLLQFSQDGVNYTTAGVGDMKKEVYDTDDDGIVDNADKLDGYHASDFATILEFSGTLSSSNWSGSSPPYTQTVTINGIKANDKPIIDVVMSGTYSVDIARLGAWGYIYRAITGTNSITFYATDIPSIDLPFTALVVRPRG